MAISAGPLFRFNESISFMVYCDTQKDIDYYWGKLSAVPEAEQCGWLKDRYGLSWQIVPTIMDEMMSDSDPEARARHPGLLQDEEVRHRGTEEGVRRRLRLGPRPAQNFSTQGRRSSSCVQVLRCCR